MKLKMEKLFFDLEFTGLHQKTTPISIGIVSESGKTFYAEFSDFDKSQVDDWIEENVINNLLFQHHISKSIGSWENWISDKKRYSNALEMALEKKDMNQFECIGKKPMVVNRLSQWLSQFDSIEIWGDCLSYDWVLFCELFGHAFNIPKNIFYIPFDICVLLNDRIGDADVNREKFIGEEKVSIIQKQIGIETKHNALFDAFVIRECFLKLQEIGRFQNPPIEILVNLAVLFNNGVIDKAKIADMVAMCQLVVDRLHENGDVLITRGLLYLLSYFGIIKKKAPILSGLLFLVLIFFKFPSKIKN